MGKEKVSWKFYILLSISLVSVFLLGAMMERYYSFHIRYVKMPEDGLNILKDITNCYGYECFTTEENKIECFAVLGKYYGDVCLVEGTMIGIDCFKTKDYENKEFWDCIINPRTKLYEENEISILRWDKLKDRCCVISNITHGNINYMCWNSTFYDCVQQLLK